MGANEKHAATYHGREYTPSTGIVRVLFKIGRVTRKTDVGSKQIDAEFNRWLETVRAEAKAEALNEMAKELESQIAGFTRETAQTRAGKDIIYRIRNRANTYK